MALKTELLNKIVKEIRTMAIIYVIAVILFKIVFFKENLLFVVRVVSSFFWMFILPGFMFMYIWHQNINFLERFIISVPVSAVIVSVTSYYISIIGLHIKYHTFLVPAFWIIVSVIIILFKKSTS